MSKYRDQLEDWLKTIDVSGELVLDIGGSALPVKDRVKSWKVNTYLILDDKTEEPAVRPDVEWDINEVYPGTDEDMMPLSGIVNRVFMLEVAEYLYDPLTALKNIYYFLDMDGGTAYISFPFVYPLHNPPHADMLRYTEHGISTLLYKAGFTDWQIDARTDKSGLLQEMYKADGMHPAKGYDHSVYGYMVTAYK